MVSSNYYDSRISCGAGTMVDCTFTTSGRDVVGTVEDGLEAAAYVATGDFVVGGGDEMSDFKCLSSLEAHLGISVEAAVAFVCNAAFKFLDTSPVEVRRSLIVRSMVHWTSIMCGGA